MRVGWLHDVPHYTGGAELTEAEFRAAAPEEVEVMFCPPGAVLPDLDAYVVHNHVSYGTETIEALGAAPVYRYHHDLSLAGDLNLVDWLDRNSTHIFCSPLQRGHYGLDGECIPPALDLERFRAVANQNHRVGAVCVGRMSYGKGLELLAEYPEPVDVYSSTPVPSEGRACYRGAAEDVAQVLSRYERFVFLPTAIEPFGRAVVEAWAAGLRIIVNRNVGALHWIQENPKGLETASEDLWRMVTG